MASVARGTPITSPLSSPTGPDTRLPAGLVQAPKGKSGWESLLLDLQGQVCLPLLKAHLIGHLTPSPAIFCRGVGRWKSPLRHPCSWGPSRQAMHPKFSQSFGPWVPWPLTQRFSSCQALYSPQGSLPWGLQCVQLLVETCLSASFPTFHAEALLRRLVPQPGQAEEAGRS